ncbi:LysR family transcriptional regulator [Tahibacter soli]|uniref:LysR family transcriptional regulator n=1 Tax=Tahibacter soli TaxID=2983605 RepID=A0A9X3YQX0_9GAMM|nr:LysR family transcriptional regulator [Tahibacter soli]MDC8015860.1 LysR family transcriptional regulator [Tahibacter soli]
MIDLNGVAVFVHTVRAGSFAGAARRLGLPSNTVSRRVQQLESELGTRLLQRSTRKLSLTTAGREFFDRSAAGVEEIELARRDLAESSHEPRGTLRVAAPADFLEHFSPDFIAEFLAPYPRLSLEFKLDDDPVDLVGEGYDLAFRAGAMPDSSLVARKLADAQKVLVASPAYLAARGTPVRVADLAAHDCINMPTGGTRTTWRLDGPHGTEEVRVAGRFAANAARALAAGARAGLGIALVPTMLVERDLETGRLVHVMPEYRRTVGGVYAVYPSRRQLSPAIGALVDFVTARFVRDGACTRG